MPSFYDIKRPRSEIRGAIGSRFVINHRASQEVGRDHLKQIVNKSRNAYVATYRFRPAQLETARLIAQQRNSGAVAPERLTVATYLDRWLAYVKPQTSPKTHERYASIACANIKPVLGTVVLAKLQPIQTSAAYAAALERLVPRTVDHMPPRPPL